jgi:hypothetical protein
MNANYLQLLLVVIYLMSGTLSIVLLVGWALKLFGRPKNRRTQSGAHEPKKPYSPQRYRPANHVAGEE